MTKLHHKPTITPRRNQWKNPCFPIWMQWKNLKLVFIIKTAPNLDTSLKVLGKGVDSPKRNFWKLKIRCPVGIPLNNFYLSSFAHRKVEVHRCFVEHQISSLPMSIQSLYWHKCRCGSAFLWCRSLPGSNISKEVWIRIMMPRLRIPHFAKLSKLFWKLSLIFEALKRKHFFFPRQKVHSRDIL